ncbi:hypothetical protein NQ318_018916 [Aromia moschata]|uniref:Glycosyl hydrolase family 38 C-terminal domain-containing protein n=1 Tax=Aromia moschata TaxID=1265417 RepID=A0AAV8ZG83_9CUCU|nr:hypothetical protein NQ318_018916 [Aromia moschata]
MCHKAVLSVHTGADGLGLEIQNVVDIEKTNNFELVMRFSTNINSSDEFFTDVNGYQLVRRKRFKKLPLQANYYPIPTMAYIEDRETRLMVITGSPLGCSSLYPGQIEVMLDRRLNQDDNLGLGQGVLDNHPTKHIFRILLEKVTHACHATTENHPAGFPTLSAHVASQTLLNPLVRLLRVEDEDTISNGAYTAVEQEFGVDFALPTLRLNVYVKGRSHTGFVIYRQFVDVCYADRVLLQQFPLSEGTVTRIEETVNISALLPIDSSKRLHKSSLSFLLVKNEVDGKGNLPLCPMEVQAFVV